MVEEVQEDFTRYLENLWLGVCCLLFCNFEKYLTIQISINL